MIPNDAAAEEVVRLRRCLSSLAGMMALPGLWPGGNPTEIANVLGDALLGVLPVAFVVVHLNRPQIELVRLASPLDSMVSIEELTRSLNSELNNDLQSSPASSHVSLHGTDVSVAQARLGFTGELGYVVTGSLDRSFPAETDRLLLDVAANQAAMVLEQIRLLSEQERITRELDQRVAQRTSELEAAHHQLEKSEYYWRLIVDNIPGMVALLSATGEVEMVNRQLTEYFGQTLAELKHWGTSGVVHFDDLPHVAEVFMRSIQAGTPYDILQRFRHRDGSYRWFTNSGFPLRNEYGEIIRWCVLLTDIDERQRAEDALRKSERELKRIIDAIPALVWCNLPDGPNDFLSSSWHEYTGLGPEEAHGWGWQSSFHPDDLPPLMKKWVAMLVSGEPDEVEARIRRHDGVYRWFLIRAQPFRDESGTIIRWYGTSTDIEDRKRAQQALESRGQDLKLIIDTIPTLSWSSGPDGSVDFLSSQWLDFTGLSAEEAHGFGWAVAVHPEDAPGLLEYWQGTLASGTLASYEARLRRHDGTYRWFLFRANALREESGKIIKWYGTNIDIEDRKRTEEELRRKEAFLAKAQRLSSSGSFSWRVDTEGVTFSDETYRIFQFEQGTPVTLQDLASRIHPEDRPLLIKKMSGTYGTGGEQAYRIRLEMPDGSMKYLRASDQDTFDESGRREYVVAVQDVTSQHIAEQSLDKARSELARVTRVSSFSALTASIAHEINQPLSGIITNASTCLRMLSSDPPNIEGARETTRRTLRDGNRVSDVIARLRALYSKKEFTPELMDLNDAAREVLAMLSNDFQRQRTIVQQELSGDLPLVTGDRVQLQQVILNLLRNALDAMATVDHRPRNLRIRTESEAAGTVLVTVQDSGLGLSGQDMDKMFDTFYTTKSGGMGIGLSVSRSIIERHHGRLWAEPNQGPGATFAFSIPIRPDLGIA